MHFAKAALESGFYDSGFYDSDDEERSLLPGHSGQNTLSKLGGAVLATTVLFLLGCRLAASAVHGKFAAQGLTAALSPLAVPEAVTNTIFALETLSDAYFAFGAYTPKLLMSVEAIKEITPTLKEMLIDIISNNKYSAKDYAKFLLYAGFQALNVISAATTTLAVKTSSPYELPGLIFGIGAGISQFNYLAQTVHDTLYKSASGWGPCPSVQSLAVMLLSLSASFAKDYYVWSSVLENAAPGYSIALASAGIFSLAVFQNFHLKTLGDLKLTDVPRTLLDTYRPKEYTINQTLNCLLRLFADSGMLIGTLGLTRQTLSQDVPSFAALETLAITNEDPVSLSAMIMIMVGLTLLCALATMGYSVPNTGVGKKNLDEHGGLEMGKTAIKVCFYGAGQSNLRRFDNDNSIN